MQLPKSPPFFYNSQRYLGKFFAGTAVIIRFLLKENNRCDDREDSCYSTGAGEKIRDHLKYFSEKILNLWFFEISKKYRPSIK
jgi:hypothetical protein